MRFGAFLLATSIVLVCGACRGVQTAQGPGFVLTSPFSRDGTEAWRTRVQRDVADVASLLGQSLPDPPVEVRLEAVDVSPDADLIARSAPTVDGKIGWETAGREVHVIVPREHDGMFALHADESLRHEFTHLFLQRMDVDAAWLQEGLAHEVQDAVRTRDGLRLHPAPLQLVLARACASTTDAAQVWSWDGSHRATPDEESAFRVISRSFVRFLIERAGDDRTIDLRRLAATRPAEDPSLVQEWRTWLDGLDFIDWIERGVRDKDEAVRAEAAAALPELAELATQHADRVPRVGRCVDAKTDAAAVAIAMGADPTSAVQAAYYLVFYRFRELPESTPAALAAADAPRSTRLIGLAVQARRGGHVDRAAAQSAWDALPEIERRHFTWLRSFLPLTTR